MNARDGRPASPESGFRRSAGRCGVTLVEVLLAFVLATLLFGIAWSLLRFGRVSTEQTLGAHVGLQMASRAALVNFVKEIQESVEIVRPPQGSTLNYFVVRDKLNKILLGYAALDSAASARAGVDLYDLYLHRHDYGATPPDRSQRKILSGVERITFTTLSPGVLQIHLKLREQGRSYALLTTVRSRNILAEGDL